MSCTFQMHVNNDAVMYFCKTWDLRSWRTNLRVRRKPTYEEQGLFDVTDTI